MELNRPLRQLLEGIPRRVLWVPPDAPVTEALRVMAENGVGAVLVLEGDRLIGVLSERDYAREGELRGRTAHRTRVQELMTRDVIYVTPDHTVEQCMAVMTGKRVRHLPVLEGEEILGVVSIGDLVKVVISHYKEIVGDLERSKQFLRVVETGYY